MSAIPIWWLPPPSLVKLAVGLSTVAPLVATAGNCCLTIRSCLLEAAPLNKLVGLAGLLSAAAAQNPPSRGSQRLLGLGRCPPWPPVNLAAQFPISDSGEKDLISLVGV